MNSKKYVDIKSLQANFEKMKQEVIKELEEQKQKSKDEKKS